jgi:serine/threonine-protein kinase HipA
MRDELLTLYLMMPDGQITAAAQLVVREENERPVRMEFAYVPDYLERNDCFALDPVGLPLTPDILDLTCDGNASIGIVEDHLPDEWGRRVMVKQALVQQNRRLNNSSVLDVVSMMGDSRIGGMMLVSQRDGLMIPSFGQGASMEALSQIEELAQRIDAGEDLDELDFDLFSLAHLASPGTGVGGARPKALIYDDHGCYLAKFNRKNNKDPYNNARVELACLNMARAAGLNVGGGRVAHDLNGRDVLLLDRFDVSPTGGRYQLASFRSLTRDEETHRLYGGAWLYDVIHDVLVKRSDRIESDCRQLLRQMIFNRAINNLDDHERNFSMMHTEDGWGLSPAYDMVPSMERGGYPVASYKRYAGIPSVDQLLSEGRVFGLGKPEIRRAGDAVFDVVSRWPVFAEEAGVSEQEMESVRRCFPPA